MSPKKKLAVKNRRARGWQALFDRLLFRTKFVPPPPATPAPVLKPPEPPPSPAWRKGAFLRGRFNRPSGPRL